MTLQTGIVSDRDMYARPLIHLSILRANKMTINFKKSQHC